MINGVNLAGRLSFDARVLHVEDHSLFQKSVREGLENLAEERGDDTFTLAQVVTVSEGQAVLEGDNPLDLVITDLKLPKTPESSPSTEAGFDIIEMAVKEKKPPIPVIVYSADDSYRAGCIYYGATAFIDKAEGIEVLKAEAAKVLYPNSAA